MDGDKAAAPAGGTAPGVGRGGQRPCGQGLQPSGPQCKEEASEGVCVSSRFPPGPSRLLVPADLCEDS